MEIGDEGMTFMGLTLGEWAALTAIIGAIAGVIAYLIRVIIIGPLKTAIDSLNSTISQFKQEVNDAMRSTENRLDKVEDDVIRHDEKINTLFKMKANKD